MSYYGDGRVSSDFVGPGAASVATTRSPARSHVYFTGSAGQHHRRQVQRRRARQPRHPGRPRPRGDGRGRPRRPTAASEPLRSSRLADRRRFVFRPREDLDLDTLKAIVADPKQTIVNRNRNAMTCGWLLRLASKRPILLSRLDLGAATVLHLPAETFVEYQLERPAAPARHGARHGRLRRRRPLVHPLEAVVRRGGLRASVANSSRETEPPTRRPSTTSCAEGIRRAEGVDPCRPAIRSDRGE